MTALEVFEASIDEHVQRHFLTQKEAEELSEIFYDLVEKIKFPDRFVELSDSGETSDGSSNSEDLFFEFEDLSDSTTP